METILKKLQVKNNRPAVPTALNTSNPKVETLPSSVTHVYVRQHDIKGLSSKYVGPFPVTSRPSRSTIEIKVGTNKNLSDRLEIRHISDVKVAYLRDDAKIAERPKRGRPKKNPPPATTPPDTPSSIPASTERPPSQKENPHSYNLRARKPTSNNVASITLSQEAGYSNSLHCTGPPPLPGFPHKPFAWTASHQDLSLINQSISGFSGA